MLREIIFDTETTGLSPKNGDRIIEIGCVELVNRARTNNTFHCFINPKRPVHPDAIKVHGIIDAFLQDKPVFAEIAPKFVEFIGDAKLVAHNAQFDMSFVNHEFSLLNIPAVHNLRVIDSLTIARKKFPGAPASLDALCKRFNISLSTRNKHGALIDAELLVNVYLNLLDHVQANFFVNANDSEQRMAAEQVKKDFRQARIFASYQEGVAGHKSFLATNIPNSLWNKKS